MSDALSNTLAKLEKLRNQRVLELDQHQQEIRQHTDASRKLEIEIRAFDTAIKIFKENDQATGNGAGTPAPLGKYVDFRLSPAVEDVVSTHGSGPGLLVPEIVYHLTTEGFKSAAENLYASVYSTALGLVKQGKIREAKKDGKRSFVRTE